MHRLGISVYLDKAEKQEIYTYIRKAAKLGYTRIFTCFLSIPKEEHVQYTKRLKEFVDTAHHLGFEVGIDTNPDVFKMLKATPDNLQPFAQLGIDILRLDGSFGGLEDIIITHNPYHIAIEFNASHDAGVALLLKNGANKEQMRMCHNFFPERYTGLDFTLFRNLNTQWKQLRLPIAAFVSSNEAHTVGPWKVSCGLPSVEILRDMPIDLQGRYLLATRDIDDIMIGNYPASDEELEALAKVQDHAITMRVEEVDGISEIERNILYDFVPHCDRPDYSTFLLRSSWVKHAYKDISIPPRACRKEMFTKGDILVVNDNLAHYRGELEVVLTQIPNDGERNFIASIKSEEQGLLEFIRPGRFFSFIK